MNRHRNLNRQSRRGGVALLLVLFAVTISATLAMSFLSSQNTTLGIARNLQNHSRARYIAESGLALTLAYVRANSDWRTVQSHGSWVTNESFGAGTFTVVGEDGRDADGDGTVDGDGDLADDTSDLATITVTGTVNGATHVARAVITPGSSGGSSYDFSTQTQGTDVLGYSDAGGGQVPTTVDTPGGAGTVMTTLEYDAIESVDGVFFSQATASVNDYAWQRFEINVSETVADITQLDITWTGKGLNTNNGKDDGAELYIWKYSGAGGSAFELLATSADTETVITLVGSVTSNVSDYFGGASQVSILVVSADRHSGVPFQNTLYTDYISISVTSGGSNGGYAGQWTE